MSIVQSPHFFTRLWKNYVIRIWRDSVKQYYSYPCPQYLVFALNNNIISNIKNVYKSIHSGCAICAKY